MKTFKDLEFKPHAIGNGLQAKMFFDNGYGVSVVRFKIPNSNLYGSYTSSDNEWELAIIYGKEGDYEITYNTGITDDVIGYLSEDEVSDIMGKVQQL